MDARPSDRRTIAALIQRFDRPGPRYTSYPTAVEFHEGVGPALYEKHLSLAAQRPSDPLSLYAHLPFCEERCLFCGCNVIVSPDKARAVPYLDLLERELEMVAERLGERRDVAQLHLGGGTPTYHPPAELERVLTGFEKHFRFLPDAERAIEVDPRVTSSEHLDVLSAHGFDRISLGVQDLSAPVQRAIGRVESREEIAALIEGARARGFRSVNADLIYGLPAQDVASFENTIDTLVELGIDRAAVYSFAYVPWIKGHQKRIDEALLPDAEAKVELFGVARERFLEAGFEPIGMDHFARPEDELAIAKDEGRLRRNFQGYTVLDAPDVIGFGISSIGDVAGLHVQDERKLSRYGEALDAGHLPAERGVVRTPEDELRRDVIHALMCNFKVDLPAVEAAHGVVFREHFARELEALSGYVGDGLVTIADDAIAATPTGELFVRNLAMCFDAYRQDPAQKGSTPVFSRTV